MIQGTFLVTALIAITCLYHTANFCGESCDHEKISHRHFLGHRDCDHSFKVNVGYTLLSV